jgi:ABC-type thiamine transport system ATPase subunit
MKPILLLDEATAAVDKLTETKMRSIIREAFTNNGHTVVEVTHRLQGIGQPSDTKKGIPEVAAVLLSKGRVLNQGSIKDMRKLVDFD